MGSNFNSAHKVFDLMAERNMFSKIWMIFGGLHSYIVWSRKVVVVVNLVLICKVSKWGESSLYFKVSTCLIYSGQPGQSQH
jgi:hypothetical protein